MNLLASADALLLVVLPYLATTIFFLGTIMRYWKAPFTYSSLSSQFLENRAHFWALVPFHFGILTVLAGHVVAFLIPRQVLLWNSRPLRLYILEASALACGLLALVGIAAAVHRRLIFRKIREVTTPLDWIVAALLLVQVLSGILVHPPRASLRRRSASSSASPPWRSSAPPRPGSSTRWAWAPWRWVSWLPSRRYRDRCCASLSRPGWTPRADGNHSSPSSGCPCSA